MHLRGTGGAQALEAKAPIAAAPLRLAVWRKKPQPKTVDGEGKLWEPWRMIPAPRGLELTTSR